jgi:DeoR/GlpR family transcriptional regulator of sugar metabolism
MTWFPRHRQEWIAEMLHVYGFINREHLMRKFSISMPQASNDLQRFARDHPKAMYYNPSRKCYVRKGL